MSINSLILSSNSALPFVLLDQEAVLGYVPEVSFQCYPIMFQQTPNRRYEQRIEAKSQLFVTSHRIIIMFLGHPQLENLIILYKQLTRDSEDIPPHLNMPWLGSNYLSWTFKVLSEQVGGNGPWLNYTYQWFCECYMEKKLASGPLRINDIFHLRDTLRNAIVNYYKRLYSTQPEYEPLPVYTP